MANKQGTNQIVDAFIGDKLIEARYTGSTKYFDAYTKPLIYGFHIDPSKSDPAEAVTYLEDAVGMTPAAMGAEAFNYGDWADAFFMPRPCMLKFDGTVDYYLDPDDYTKKTDGTAANIYQQEVNGNAMMEWPLIWYKFEAGETPGEGYFYCSDQQVDSDYKCWCNINSQGQQIPHFYTSIYNCYSTNSHQKLRSLSGKSLVQGNHGMLTAQQEITRALANNTTNAVEWYTAVFADRQLISALLILMSKTLDNQRAFGRGRVKIGASASANKTFKESYETGGTGGTLNHKGLFYGSLSNDETAVKVFGMENWWGEAFTRTAGLVSVNDKYMYKLTYGTADGSTASAYNLTGTDYLEGGNRPSTSQQNVQQMSFGAWGFLPSVTASDPNYETYYCENIYSDGDGYALFGGGVGEGYAAGATYLNIENSTALSYFTVGTCLSCKPILRTEG